MSRKNANKIGVRGTSIIRCDINQVRLTQHDKVAETWALQQQAKARTMEEIGRQPR